MHPSCVYELALLLENPFTASPVMDARVARQTWELENRIEPVTQRDADAIYRYDEAAQSANLAAKPWTKDPHYFKTVRISALALLKMVVHARSGGNIEVRPRRFIIYYLVLR